MTVTAKVYGGSLYDLAAEEKTTDVIKEQMDQIRQLFWENPDYLHLLSEPAVPLGERTGLIEEAFGAQAERNLVNFLKLLCERGLLREYAGCCEEYSRRYNADNGIAQALVTSAVPLKDEQKAALKEKLEKMSGKRVSLEMKIDPGVLAGLRVEMEGKQLDGTAAGRIAGISRKLEELVVGE